jgi:hypothetical protein
MGHQWRAGGLDRTQRAVSVVSSNNRASTQDDGDEIEARFLHGPGLEVLASDVSASLI